MAKEGIVKEAPAVKKTPEPLRIWHTSSQRNMLSGYVVGLFRYYLAKKGLRTDHSKDFNVIFYTLYSPGDVYKLAKLREQFPKTLIIAGGIEGFTPAYILNFADFVCAGEGYHFMKNFPTDKGVEGLIEWCKEQSYLTYRGKLGKPTYPSYEIPWHEIPAVQVSKKMYYFLVGRGCRNKCSFCFTSWANKYQTVPPKRLAPLRALADRGRSIYFVGNDTGEFATLDCSAAQSVSVKRFLQAPHKYAKSKFLHIGIEGLTPQRRLWYRKPIEPEEIRSVLAITKRLKIDWELFLIVHQPFDVDAFVEELPADIDRYPRVVMKFTHLDPTPYTPMENHDLMNECDINRDEIFCKVAGKNRRFRSFPVMRAAQEHTFCILRRSTLEQARIVMESRKFWRKSLDEWREFIFKHGLEDVYRGNFEKDFPMVMPYAKACETVKKKFVLPNDGNPQAELEFYRRIKAKMIKEK